jgi:hypothetical protein
MVPPRIMKLRSLAIVVGVSLAVLATATGIFFVWLSGQNIGDENPNSTADRDDPDSREPDEFPDLVLSDSRLGVPNAVEFKLTVTDTDNLPLPDAPYCVVFESGLWYCGNADKAGHTQTVFLDHEQTYTLDTYEEAVSKLPVLRSMQFDASAPVLLDR